MLTPAEVIPFLLHEEGFVRRHAATYLTEANDPSPATAEDIWRGIDQYGMWGTSGFVADLAKLPQTEHSLWKAMGILAGTLDERSRHHIEKSVMAVGMPLLEQHREALLGGLQLSDKAKSHLLRRLELKNRDATEMWGELMTLAEGFEGFDDEGHQEATRLVEAIGKNANRQVIAAAMEMLREEERDDWRQVYAVDVLGEMRHEQAVDGLLEQLRAEDDAMPQHAVNALVRIGTVEVVRKVEAFLAAEEWEVCLFGIEALERIKKPESEEALMRMLERETRQDLATLIGDGLCYLCASPAILEKLRDMAAVGLLGGDIGEDIEGYILAAGRMSGYEPPENKKWTERALQLDGKMEQMREMVSEAVRRDQMRNAEPADVPGWEDEVTMPIRAEEKIGRNDPCPCGSGKKYKKCCGKN